MPLLDIKTDLTSLRFGNDRPGNGSSKQPFIRKDIPGKGKSFLDQIEDERTGVYGMTAANDLGFIRGGILRPGAALNDVERILKLYSETAVGLAFNAKQVLLSLQDDGSTTFIPPNILGQLGLNAVGFGHLESFTPIPKPQFSQENTFGMANPSFGTGFNEKITFRGEGDSGRAVYQSTDGKTPGALASDVTDKINNSPLVYSSERSENIPEDVVNFDIAVIDNDNPSNKVWIHLRAYLKSFSDSYGAGWDTVRYVGRGEDFFKYGGFTRDISMGFDVLVGSAQEQDAVYEKLNYLASCMAPDYSESGFMRGSIFRLTVGDYLVDVPGVVTGLNYSVPNNVPWDIARKNDGTRDPYNQQLPHIVEVGTFNFKPIHNFIPRRVQHFGGTEYDPYTKFIGRNIEQVNTDING